MLHESSYIHQLHKKMVIDKDIFKQVIIDNDMNHEKILGR